VCWPLECSNRQIDVAIGEVEVDCGGQCKPCDMQDTCLDTMQNAGETGLDCGGETTCPRCPNDQGCGSNSDCESGYCDVATLKCQTDPCSTDPTECNGGAGGAPNGTGGTAGGTPPLTGGTGDGGSEGGDGGAPEGGSGAVSEGGTSPQGGTGGTTGGGGTGGSTGGAQTPLTTCATGCARLRVPLAAATDWANYVITLRGTADFSAAVVTARVYVEQGTGGEVRLYVQHSGSPDFSQLVQIPGVPLTDILGWRNVVFDVGAQSTSFTKNNVGRVGVQVIGASGTSFTDPTIVAVDSVTLTGVGPVPIVFQFDTQGSIQTTPASTGPADIMFLNDGDNVVDGSTLGWIPRP
jgi:hypothetical protein